MNFVANVPYIKCYVKKEYLYDLEKGHGEFEECVLISVKSGYYKSYKKIPRNKNNATLLNAYQVERGDVYGGL